MTVTLERLSLPVHTVTACKFINTLNGNNNLLQHLHFKFCINKCITPIYEGSPQTFHACFLRSWWVLFLLGFFATPHSPPPPPSKYSGPPKTLPLCCGSEKKTKTKTQGLLDLVQRWWLDFVARMVNEDQSDLGFCVRFHHLNHCWYCQGCRWIAYWWLSHCKQEDVFEQQRDVGKMGFLLHPACQVLNSAWLLQLDEAREFLSRHSNMHTQLHCMHNKPTSPKTHAPPISFHLSGMSTSTQ